ncbi:MAG: hypothetical protein HGB19_01175 [Chlorobiales bacterium]|jgi:nitrogen-specific signal transduction histidine kinase|nr:hypothetical protein [Chlorobiales bacterium]
MPNVAIVSELSRHVVQVQRAIMRQTYKAEIFSYSHIRSIPSDIDLIYINVGNSSSHIDAIERLHSYFLLTPITAFITSNTIEFAIKAIRAGVSDVVYLTGNLATDHLELANSVYRGIQKRQNLIAAQQSLAENFITRHFSDKLKDALSSGLINQMQQAVVVLGKNYEVVSINREAERILGEAEITIEKRDISPLLHLSGEEKEKIFQRGESHRGELTIPNETHLKTIGYTISPRYLASGELEGAMMVFKDITADKQLRFQAQKNEKMQTLGDIAAAISHEVKNPLAGIKSMVQAVMLDMDPKTDNYLYIQRILQEVDRINAFIESTFAFARHKRLKLVKTNISSIVDSAISLLAENLKTNKIRVIKDYPHDLPQAIVDPDQIHQVFLNVLLNSIEGLSQTSDPAKSPAQIKISVREVLLPAGAEPTRHIKITFEDNGPGLSEDVLEKVFDPFFTTKPSGTGLGLSICYKIIKEHYGSINLHNALDGGAVVSITLPINVSQNR